MRECMFLCNLFFSSYMIFCSMYSLCGKYVDGKNVFSEVRSLSYLCNFSTFVFTISISRFFQSFILNGSSKFNGKNQILDLCGCDEIARSLKDP